MTPTGADGNSEIVSSKIVGMVEQQLPHWRKACDHVGADTVFLNQRAFGDSDKEMLLLAVATKNAGIAKKNVTITPD